eukprot:503830-Pyramimonas_sp.AAC.1
MTPCEPLVGPLRVSRGSPEGTRRPPYLAGAERSFHAGATRAPRGRHAGGACGDRADGGAAAAGGGGAVGGAGGPEGGGAPQRQGRAREEGGEVGRRGTPPGGAAGPPREARQGEWTRRTPGNPAWWCRRTGDWWTGKGAGWMRWWLSASLVEQMGLGTTDGSA